MKYAKRQRQKKHNYFFKVKQLTSPSKFSTIQNWKLKLMKGKWYRISKLPSFPPAVGHQRCINLHVLSLYWKCSRILLSDVEGMGCYSWLWTEPQCILLASHDIAEASFAPYFFVVFLRQFAWKTKGLSYVQCDLCDDDELMQQRHHAHIFGAGLTELIFLN